MDTRLELTSACAKCELSAHHPPGQGELPTDRSRTIAAGFAAWGTFARSHRVARALTSPIQVALARAFGEEWLPG